MGRMYDLYTNATDSKFKRAHILLLMGTVWEKRVKTQSTSNGISKEPQIGRNMALSCDGEASRRRGPSLAEQED